MSVRHALGKVRWGAISAVDRREAALGDAGPVVSFTFDDFPQSALHAGGAILKSHGVRGTYYTAMGLMGQTNKLGRHFDAPDLRELVRDGHELGSHTFGHLSGREVSPAEFEADVAKGIEAVEKVQGRDSVHSFSHSFSYPYGHATMRLKRRIGAMAASCRGVVSGVNESPADLNFLRANHLYSWSFDMRGVEQLLAANQKGRGWLIFYTHDVTEKPSDFGCTPTEFESVVRLAVKTCGNVMPVGQVVAGLPHGGQAGDGEKQAVLQGN